MEVGLAAFRRKVISMTENIVTRRNILKAGAVAAGALALGTLSGCSSNDSENNDANQVSIPDSGILPLGSVVQLKAFEGTELKHVVICRRPKVSSGRELNSDGSISETTEKKVFDYGVVQYPISFYSDLSDVGRDFETILITADMIASVVFVGYFDDREKQAGELIAQAGSDQTIDVILKDEMNEIYASVKTDMGIEQ